MSTRRYPAPEQTTDYQYLVSDQWADEPYWTNGLTISSGGYFSASVRPVFYAGVLSYGANYFSGDTGVGVYTPTYRLSVYDSVSTYVASFRNYYNTDTADVLAARLRHASPTTSAFYLACYDTSTSETGGSLSGGVTGDGSGGVDFATSSDRRLKTDIEPADRQSTLDTLRALPLVAYSRGDKQGILGFVAQDLHAVCPEAAVDPTARNEATFVLTDEVEEEDEKGEKKKVERRRVVEPGTDGAKPVKWGDPEYMPWMISPMKLIPILTGAVQALAAQVEEQAATIADLRGRLDVLERQNPTGPSSNR